MWVIFLLRDLLTKHWFIATYRHLWRKVLLESLKAKQAWWHKRIKTQYICRRKQRFRQGWRWKHDAWSGGFKDSNRNPCWCLWDSISANCCLTILCIMRKDQYHHERTICHQERAKSCTISFAVSAFHYCQYQPPCVISVTFSICLKGY